MSFNRQDHCFSSLTKIRLQCYQIFFLHQTIRFGGFFENNFVPFCAAISGNSKKQYATKYTEKEYENALFEAKGKKNQIEKISGGVNKLLRLSNQFLSTKLPKTLFSDLCLDFLLICDKKKSYITF